MMRRQKHWNRSWGTFGLRFHEFSSNGSDNFDKLVDIRESRFGDDLPQDKDGLECSSTGTYNLPVMIYDAGV
jgi:hypothetical protein